MTPMDMERERALGDRRLGCWIVAAVLGLAVAFPTLYVRACSGHRPHAAPAPRRPRVCLEAWVRLRSHRGCPVLAAAGGYRLMIHCSASRASNGALVFAGPFPGRAYVSDRPVPLGRWVHLAGIEAGAAWQPGPKAARVPQAPAAIAFDGVEVTAGRVAGWLAPLPLGYDPWEARAGAARAAPLRSADGRSQPGPGRLAASGAIDGETGAWRLSRGARSLPQIAAARGTPWRLAPLPGEASRASDLAAGAVPARLAGGEITRRGWAIFAAGLLLTLAMTGAGIALRRQTRDDGGA